MKVGSSHQKTVARVVLLVPCLLICVACATPFPFEDLEEGMTAKAVRQTFGGPRSIEGKETWTYAHGEWTGMLMPPFVFVVEKRVVLRFENDKLIRWIVIGWAGGTEHPPEGG